MLQGSNNNNQNYIKLSTIYTFQFVTFSPTNYLNNRWLLVTWKNRFKNTRFPNRIYFYISLSDILIFLQYTTNSSQNPSIKIHQSQSIYRFPIYPPPSRPSLLFTTRLDRNPNHRPRPISRWIIHDGIESIAFPPRQTPIILLKDLSPEMRGRFSFHFQLPLSFQFFTLRVSVYRVTFSFEDERMRLLEKAGLGRRPPLFAARRVEGLSTVFRGLCLRGAIPPTQITSCLEADALRGAKVKQVRRRCAALNGKSVNVVNRNKRGATRSFRLRKHKTTRGVFINEVTLS